MILENLTNSQVIESLGWTLLHSIWQVALIGFWLCLILRASVKSSANSRYLASLFALGLTLIVPLATYAWLSQNSSSANQNVASNSLESTAVSDEKIPAQENQAFFENAKIDRPDENNFFVSVGNWRSGLAGGLAALSPILVGLWFLGVVFSLIRLFGGVWQLRIYTTRETFAPDKDWQAKFDNLCERLKVNQTVVFVRSKIVETPMVIGWLKPIVLVPASVFTGMNARELETILAHELVHIRRYDYAVNFAQNFVEILFFYHPAAWWISANIRRERECACDDEVVKMLENSSIVYARALANLEAFRQKTSKQTRSPVLVAANGGKLMKRIERILGKNKNAKTGVFQTSLWSASLVSAIILALLLGLFSQATDLPVNAQTKYTNGKAKKIAVGFVSIPPNFNGKADESFDETARLLIEKLTARRIPAIGFVNGSSISPEPAVQERINSVIASISKTSDSLSGKTSSDPEEIARMRAMVEITRAQTSKLERMFTSRAEVVKMWRDAGLEVGIGGYQHIWFHDTPLDEYIANAERNEQITRKILAEKNTLLRYFSYPFLNTGRTAEDNRQFENWLANRDLKSVKYTFDNQEWMYSFAYDRARENKDAAAAARVKTEFLEYMTKMLAHYEAYSQEMFGRDIAQTLVLTPSRLVADSADELFGMFEKSDYQFVSMDEAQADEAYRTEEKIIESKSGTSWFERWQLAKGRKLRDEPPVGESIQRMWETRLKNPPPPPAPPAPPAKKFL